MNYLNPEIKLEKELAAQIYDALQGDVVKYQGTYVSLIDQYRQMGMMGRGAD